MLPIPGRSVCRRQHLSGNCDDCKDFLRRSATRSGFRDRSICNATTDRPVVRAPSEDHLSSRPTARLNDSSAGLDFNRRKPQARPGPRGKPPAGRPVRQDAKVLLHPASEHARQGRVRHAPALSRISLQDRIGSSPPAEGKNRVQSALAVGQGFLQPRRTWERLREATSFWSAGRRPSD